MSTGPTLIHPHPQSQLPGYKGYTPQLKFQCGHTYGFQTDHLLTEFANANITSRKTSEKLKLPDLPSCGQKDDKYLKGMVPGYTGFVPQFVFKYGQTYALGTEDAISESKYNYRSQSAKLQDLSHSVRNPRTLLKDAPKTQEGHAGVNRRYVTGLVGSKYDGKRAFTEAPVPGYQGYVPRKEEHILGDKYNVWTRHAYCDAAETIEAKEKTPPNLSKPHTSPGGNRFIYSKKLGMVPNYTGYVPQRQFSCGYTYGDSTRTMPVCFDTAGYAGGKYNEARKGVNPTVIPVRI